MLGFRARSRGNEVSCGAYLCEGLFEAMLVRRSKGQDSGSPGLVLWRFGGPRGSMVAPPGRDVGVSGTGEGERSFDPSNLERT